MLFLALAVTCSVAIGMIFKVAGYYDLDRTALLTVNYAAAVGVAIGLIALGGRGASDGLTTSAPLLLLGVGTGALLIFGFFMLSVSTDVAGMSLSIGVMRVSVVIPFLASWVVWSEEPSTWQLAGMGLASVAFFLIAQKQQESTPEPAMAGGGDDPPHPLGSEEGEDARAGGGDDTTDALPEPNARVLGTLFILFLSGGAVDITMKTFQESFGADNSRFLFLLLAFGIAFLIGLAIVLFRGVRYGAWPDRRTVLWGTILGVINYGSLEFLLRALEVLPGTVVFPVNNIAIVILAALLGVTVWKERLSRTNQIGLAFAVAGLILLNV